ncbi:hypothetical protein [Arthrobacter sp. zg-Y1110]|uniref:hypothetical protein n=1 Tax=Arthrobacter sp. zg-Y1110 TaxID=2886932 RepID=UPI001D147F98|nr:hypothetical protein [Arthrobacter sp. zg-Y1110]MCC3292874.1 hypothetical protein [Arthrobacter sp. zg-Y1110]UWX86812.1 hypothetical protein N2K99_18390 [Arthrobacter sp. zg-Y1110]
MIPGLLLPAGRDRTRNRGGRGYHRTRPQPLEPVSFTINGHRFETSGRDLWVTPAGRRRADRIKVTRSTVSSSARAGYPSALVWPRLDIRRSLEDLKETARFWISWSSTEDYARFPEVGLDQWLRRLEA